MESHLPPLEDRDIATHKGASVDRQGKTPTDDTYGAKTMRTHPCWVVTYLMLGGPWVWLPFIQSAAGQLIEIPHTAEPQSSSGTEGRILLRAPWGSAPGEFGKTDEASRPGPMDFAVVEDDLYVLDTVNARVQVFGLEGHYKTAIPIGTKTADFLCVGPDGEVAVLDAFCRRQLSVFSPGGKLRRSMKLPEAIGLPSAVFTDGRCTWVEDRHNRVLEISAVDDKEDTPARVVSILPGRPMAAGRGTMHALRKDERDVLIHLAAKESEETFTVRFPHRLLSIVTLEADGTGNVCVAAVCENQAAEGQPQRRIVATTIERSTIAARVVSMPDAYITDHYRKLWLLESGDLVQMQTTKEEVRFLRWTPEPVQRKEVSQ